MNATRWLFEAWQMAMEDDQYVKVASQIGEQALKGLLAVLVSVLGLNLEPIAEPDPAEPSKTRYRWAKEGEFTPMILAIARKDYVTQAMEKIESLTSIDDKKGSIDTPDHELGEEDLLFLDELTPDVRKAVWDSATMQDQLKQRVILKKVSDVDPYAKVQPRPEGAQASFAGRRGPATAPKRFHLDLDQDPLPTPSPAAPRPPPKR